MEETEAMARSGGIDEGARLASGAAIELRRGRAARQQKRDQRREMARHAAILGKSGAGVLGPWGTGASAKVLASASRRAARHEPRHEPGVPRQLPQARELRRAVLADRQDGGDLRQLPAPLK